MKHLKTGLITLLIATFVFAGAVQAQNDDHHTIGIIELSIQLEDSIQPFVDRLVELGYLEGDAAEIWAELREARIIEQEALTLIFPPAIGEDLESLPDVVQSMVDAGVEVIFAVTQAEAAAGNTINDQIPMVFAVGADPVGAGLVESLTEPVGNITGIASAVYQGRGLQLLLEIDPSIERVYFAYKPEDSANIRALEAMEEAVEDLEVEIVTYEFSDLDGVLQGVRGIPDDIDAIVLSNDLESYEPQVLFGWIGASMRLRAGISIAAYAPVPGVLMGYGPDLAVNSVTAAEMVDQILRGADPATMPVLNSEYALMVNMVVAESLGIDIPRAILRQAGTIMRATDETDEATMPEAEAEEEASDD